jgi:putative membrane protein
MKQVSVIALIILGVSFSPAWARGKTQIAKPSSDQEFIAKAAQANIAEVELGKLAQSKASSNEVKNFASRMVSDHQQALNDLKGVAEKEKVAFPTTADPKSHALKDRLEKLSGPAFDRAYIDAMVKDHRADIAEFKAQSQKATDPDVKQYAINMLPTLEDHLKMAESARAAVAGTSGKGNPPKKMGD